MSKPGNSENEPLSKSDPRKKEQLSSEPTRKKNVECPVLFDVKKTCTP